MKKIKVKKFETFEELKDYQTKKISKKQREKNWSAFEKFVKLFGAVKLFNKLPT